MGPLTRAERTNYRETSLYADVKTFVSELSEKTDRMRAITFGKSQEGRDMQLLVLSNQKLFTPQQARASGKPVVLVINNIHAGEVEGKEASLILAREMTLGGLNHLLDDLIILIVPLFNVDGNERISCRNRMLDLVRLEGQIGPDGGVGTRYTAAGFNLNRDHIKQEAVEMVHLTRDVYYVWMPHLTIDCHTTDGSIHAYDLTYGTAMNYAGAAEPIEYTRTKLLPTITDSLFKRTGYRTQFYGNWIDEREPRKGWATYSHLPRYGSNYRGLTNRLDILSEVYSYLPFDRRVAVNREFLLEIFQYCAAHAQEIVQVTQNAERETIRRGQHPGDPVGLQWKLEPYKDEIEILRRHFTVSMEIDTATGSVRYTNFQQAPDIETIRTPYYGKFVPTKTVRRPYAYLIPREARSVVDKLRIHNIRVETLTAEQEFEVETYHVTSVRKIKSVDYGDHPREEHVLEVEPGRARRKFEAGTFVVRLAQPQGNLIVYLLEPESDDGLGTWGFFEEYVTIGGEFPVVRVPAPFQ